MCNVSEQRIGWEQSTRAIRDLDLGIPTRQSDADLPQTDQIRIGDVGPVMRASDNLIELAPMRFGFPPAAAQSLSRLQLPLGGPTLSRKQTLPDPGERLLRIHGKEVPKGAAPILASRCTRMAPENRRIYESFCPENVHF
jgi:hypothetical protein